jgi:hypothetical protein
MITQTAASFLFAIGGLPPLMASVAIDQRTKFVDGLYGFLSGFFTRHAACHVEFIKSSSLPQAQSVVDALLAWKSSPDPDWLCAFGALLPFCTGSLQGLPGPKRHPLTPVLSGLSEFKQKRESAACSVACGLLELATAVYLHKDKIYRPFADLLSRVQPKLEAYYFDNKQRKEVGPRMLAAWLPRYAALEHAKDNGLSGPAVHYLLNLIDRPAGWQVVLAFLGCLYQGAPIGVDPLPTRAEIFPALSTHLISSEKGEGCLSFVEFFTGEMHMEAFRLSSRSMESMANVVSCVLSFVGDREDVAPFVGWLRLFFSCGESFARQLSQIPTKSVVNMILQIALAFRLQVERTFLIISPAISCLPCLLHKFLVWTRFVLANTQMTEPTSLPGNFFSVVGIALFTSLCDRQMVAKCDEVLKDIFEVGRPHAKYVGLVEALQYGSDEVIRSTRTIITGWLGQLDKQLTSENKQSNIPQLARMPNGFPATRERIATITGHICDVIHFLANLEGPTGGGMESAFASIALDYIFASDCHDSLFARALGRLPEASYPAFVAAMNEAFAQRFADNPIEHPMFWANVVGAVKVMLKSGRTSPPLVEVAQNLLLYIVTVFDMMTIDDSTSLCIDVACSFVARLATCVDDKPWRVWHAAAGGFLRIGLRCLDAGRKGLLKLILVTFPSIVTALHFNPCHSFPHIDIMSGVTVATESVSVAVRALIKLWSGTADQKTTLAVQQSLDSIVASNSLIAWPIYLHLLKDKGAAVQSILLDALAVMFHATSSPGLCPSGPIPMNTKTSETGQRFHGRVMALTPFLLPIAREKADLLRTNIEKTAAVMYSSQFLNRRRCFAAVNSEHGTLYSLLRADNFRLFREPPSNSIRFLQAAIACCISLCIHDQAFAAMLTSFTNSSRSFGDNAFSRFFCAWFKQMSLSWDLGKFIVFARPGAIEAFCANFNPPASFVYYLHAFNEPSLVGSLLIECFVRPLLYYPLDYGLSVRYVELKRPEFIQSLSQHQSYHK